METKRSYGIICRSDTICRATAKKQSGGLQLLMIKRNVSYSFIDFVLGRYRDTTDKTIMRMLNGMSHHEKMDILNMKYQNLWYRIYANNPETSKTKVLTVYLRRKAQFERNFMSDGGRRIKYLIGKSRSVEVLWEFPKGGAHADELPMDAAIREFHEETGVQPGTYTILWHVPPLIFSFVECNIRYIMTYWFADAHDNCECSMDYFNRCQYAEVQYVKWVSRADIDGMMLGKAQRNRLIRQWSIATRLLRGTFARPTK